MNGQELTVLNNIFSLMQELSGLLKTEDGMEDTMTEDPMMTEPSMDDTMIEEPIEGDEDMADETTKGFGMDEDEEDDNLLEKGLETTPSDGADANDDAPERIDDPLPEESADNVDKVAKAVLNLVQGMNINKVKKSRNSNEVLPVIQDLLKVTKAMVNKQNVQESAITSLIEGMGLADNIEKLYATDTKTVQKGLGNPKDTNATLDYIAKALGKVNPENQKQDVMGQADSARKSVSNFITTLANSKK